MPKFEALIKSLIHFSINLLLFCLLFFFEKGKKVLGVFYWGTRGRGEREGGNGEPIKRGHFQSALSSKNIAAFHEIRKRIEIVSKSLQISNSTKWPQLSFSSYIFI